MSLREAIKLSQVNQSLRKDLLSMLSNPNILIKYFSKEILRPHEGGLIYYFKNAIPGIEQCFLNSFYNKVVNGVQYTFKYKKYTHDYPTNNNLVFITIGTDAKTLDDRTIAHADEFRFSMYQDTVFVDRIQYSPITKQLFQGSSRLTRLCRFLFHKLLLLRQDLPDFVREQINNSVTEMIHG